VIRGFSEALGFFFAAFFVLLAAVAFAPETRRGLAFLETVLAFLETAPVFVEAALVFLDTVLAFVDEVLAALEGALAFFFFVDFAEAAATLRFEADGFARAGRFAAPFLGVFRLEVLDFFAAAFALISSSVNACVPSGNARRPIADGLAGSAATAAEPAHLTKKAR
jgi:hypothetical protein